jgi:hypothetical protein
MKDSDRYGPALRRGQRCPDRISGGRRSSNATAPPTSPRSRSRRGGRGWDRSDPAPGLTRGSSSTPHGPTWRGIGEYGAGRDRAPSSFGRDRAFSAMRPLLLARPGGASGQRRYGGHARSCSRGSCSESTPACRERDPGVPFKRCPPCRSRLAFEASTPEGRGGMSRSSRCRHGARRDRIGASTSLLRTLALKRPTLSRFASGAGSATFSRSTL